MSLGMRVPINRRRWEAEWSLTGHTVHVENLAEAVDFPEGRLLAQRHGNRDHPGAPLLREGVPIGVILISRTRCALSDNQIALLNTFARSARHPIENVRLFNEIQERTHELEQSLEEIRALGEVSPRRQLPSTWDRSTATRSPSRPLSSAMRTPDSSTSISRRGASYRTTASWNASEEFVKAIQSAQITLGREPPAAALERKPVQIPTF